MTQGFEQLLAIAGLTDHLQVSGQTDQLLDPFTHDGVVFGYQNTNHWLRSCATGSNGM